MTRWRGNDRGPFAGRCDYCGRACYGIACEEHRDLPQIEHALISRIPRRGGRALDETGTGTTNAAGAARVASVAGEPGLVEGTPSVVKEQSPPRSLAETHAAGSERKEG